MTTMKSPGLDVVVVDGSNIATEGRSAPSLSQLNDAVLAFREEFPDATTTVVVDATFGHRIDKSEVGEFDAAVAHNELVAPPAGAIGRGDAFVLSIANKVGARILSNDSFQEFHGTYPWLFDEGRLIGGKPVPFVGWVFVERLPVKGPTSRKSQRAAREREPATNRRTASRAASQPMPVPTAPPPSARRGAARADTAPMAIVVDAPVVSAAAAAAAPSGSAVNDLLPFLDFVERHPIGSSVNGVVESYSSHGAYVQIGDLRGYVPLRLMGEPAPRSAREVMRVGDAVTLVVATFAPARRSVDLAVPTAAQAAVLVMPDVDEAAAEPAPRRKRGSRRAAAAETPVEPTTADGADVAEAVAEAAAELVTDAVPADATPRPRRTRAAKAAAAAPAAEPAPAKRTRAKRATQPEAPAADAPAPTEPARKATGRRRKAVADDASTTEAPATEATTAKTSKATKATKASRTSTAKQAAATSSTPAATKTAATRTKAAAATKATKATKATEATKATKTSKATKASKTSKATKATRAAQQAAEPESADAAPAKRTSRRGRGGSARKAAE